MKNFKDIQRLNEAATKMGKVDPEGYYAVYKSGGKLKVAGPYSTESAATDYNYEGLVDVLDGAELVRSEYRGIRVVKESLGLDEAAGNEKSPGKPETMAQKHGRMLPRGFKKRKEWVVYCREILKDWKSGDMALSRLESVMSEFQSIGYGVQNFDTRGMTEPFDPKYIDAVGKAFKKSIGKGERVGRMGKTGYGFNPAMGRVTPNEITAYLQAVLDFCENEWADLDKQYGIK
jgi:hypothetical protein